MRMCVFFAYLVFASFAFSPFGASASTVSATGTISLSFDATFTSNGCSGEIFSTNSCVLKYDDVELGETYQGDISVAGLFEISGDTISAASYGSDGYSVKCVLAGKECNANDRSFEFRLVGLFGNFFFASADGNLSELFSYRNGSGTFFFQDDQGDVFQTVQANLSGLSIRTTLSEVPAPTAGVLLASALLLLGFRSRLT